MFEFRPELVDDDDDEADDTQYDKNKEDEEEVNTSFDCTEKSVCVQLQIFTLSICLICSLILENSHFFSFNHNLSFGRQIDLYIGNIMSFLLSTLYSPFTLDQHDRGPGHRLVPICSERG